MFFKKIASKLSRRSSSAPAIFENAATNYINMGEHYWRFRLQRRVSDGSIKTPGPYRLVITEHSHIDNVTRLEINIVDGIEYIDFIDTYENINENRHLRDILRRDSHAPSERRQSAC